MHLDFMLLKVLQKEDLSGYQLVKVLEKETGWKPSYGSLYPMLQSMARKKFLMFKQEGRSKVYSITKKGRNHLLEFEKNRDKYLARAGKNIIVMNKLVGDHSNFFKFLFQRLRAGKLPFGPATPEALELRNTLLRLAASGKIEKEPGKIKVVLSKAVRELKKI